jgi:three-Cys-motif partner protein
MGPDERPERAHEFGGDWTAAKLEVLADYLKAYTTALKNQPFRKWYIDGFAGSGSILRGKPGPGPDSQALFPKEDSVDPGRILDGSARIALKTTPRFDHFVFIERDVERCNRLHDLRAELSVPATDVQIVQDDVNAALAGIQKADWVNRRAVLFLDPYGMQLEWRTIEAIAATKAIDMWLLFPLMGASRMLTASGDMPQAWSTSWTRSWGHMTGTSACTASPCARTCSVKRKLLRDREPC